MAAPHWRTDHNPRPLWSSTQSCGKKGFQSPTPLTLSIAPRAHLLTRAFFMSSEFTVPYSGCQTGHSQLSNLNRERPHVYPSWGSEIWCPAVITPEDWTPEASLQWLLPGTIPREGHKSLTDRSFHSGLPRYYIYYPPVSISSCCVSTCTEGWGNQRRHKQNT